MMEGGVDETYNFKSTSSISTNYNSRPRSTYMNQRQQGGKLMKNQQSRSVSPNTFQPLYLEQKCNNSKNTFMLKKINLSTNKLQDVLEANQSIELMQSIGSQGEKQLQKSKRPASSNAIVRISQGNGYNNNNNNLNRQMKQNNNYLDNNDLPQMQTNQSQEISSTNNTYYNQFYNVSKILVNQTENNLDLSSSFLDYTNNSVINGFNKTNNVSGMNHFDTTDHSQFNSNSKSVTKSKVLGENQQNNYSKELRSLSRISSRNTKVNNNQNVLSNSKSFVNKQSSEILISEGGKIKSKQIYFNDENDSNSKENNMEEKENEQNENENEDDAAAGGEQNKSKNHTKKEYMNEKEVKNISFYINNMMYEDFKVYTDAQLLSKMDRESLIIRLQLLEQENKEIKCHNIHLSSKFKEMLNEYTRYKEYQENIDRKSLYQKHVSKLAELSKTCHDQCETIKQKNQKIHQLSETIEKRENELKNLQSVIDEYDVLKAQELIDVENRFKDQIKEYQERVDYLNKENRKILLLEKSYKDILDRMNEDKNKFLNALDKAEDRYKLLSNKQSEKDRDIWHLKEKIKELEYSIKFTQEQSLVVVQEKCNEYEKKLSKLEVDQHSINIQHTKQEKQLITEIQHQNEQNEILRKYQTEQEAKTKEKMEGLNNVIQSQNESYLNFKAETVNQIADILSKNEILEKTLEEKKSIIEVKKKEITQKMNKIIELQKKIESIIQSKQKMKEEHEREMNQIFKSQQDSTSSLTFKIKEMKLYYEVEIENMKKECDERIKEHSSNATDAKRQYFAMKNNYSQDIEGKENEIDFLKNKIYEEKQKIKEQIDQQYKDMIKDMQKRVTFLQSELDDQKIEIENSICEDLAVYNRHSKYWKKSRDIREEKYSYKSINSEDSRKGIEYTPIKKRQTISNKPNTTQLTQQDILKIRFQTIAKSKLLKIQQNKQNTKCAVAFEEQQQKIEKLRTQIDVLSKKANNLLKQQYLVNGGRTQNDQQHNYQKEFNTNSLNRQNAMQIDENIQSENDLLLDDNDIKDLELAKQVKDLRDQLYQQRLKNQEIQNLFIQKEYEINEEHKQTQKKMQQQFDIQNQVKIQQVFEKNILIEKQQSKITELQKLLEESTLLNQEQIVFVDKMKKEFQELDKKNKSIVQIVKDEKDQLIQMWENRESLSTDLREIERLNAYVIKLSNEIKQLKTQILNLHHTKNSNVTGGLVYESQLRTSFDLPISQKIQVESINSNTSNLFTKSDFVVQENKNRSGSRHDFDINKSNINKSIPLQSNKEGKKDYNRQRTKTSIKSEREVQDLSSIHSNNNN